MILWKIYKMLERIERNQRTAQERENVKSAPADEWLQKGLDSIMSFQAGKKKEDGE